MISHKLLFVPLAALLALPVPGRCQQLIKVNFNTGVSPCTSTTITVPGGGPLAGGESFIAAGGTGTVDVTASACSWTASSNKSWITITSGASGSGDGTVGFTVAANTGAERSGSITITGNFFTVEQDASASQAGLYGYGSIPQIASGGGWDTELTLVNTGASSSEGQIYFSGNNGSALALPFTFPQQSGGNPIFGTTLDGIVASNATFIVDTTSSSGTSDVGWAVLYGPATGSGGAFAIFTYTPTGQAAVVPLETRNASSYLLPFDDTGAISTGLAIANVADSAASVHVVIRNDTGAPIGTGSINLPASGHTSFMLTDTSSGGWAVTAGVRGTVEFDTPFNGQISVLGLRANAIPNSSGFAVTTIPTLASVGTTGGSMAHIASGGGWQTTFTLVNTGASAATATLNFYGGNGNAVSLPLSFPQTGATSTATNVSQSIAAGASLIVVLQDGAASATTGSAVLTTNGNVGGFAIFRYNTTGQEAVVPLEKANAANYVLAFDNTGTLATGLAIANVAAQAASVGVILRDDTGLQIGTGSINLPAQGHTSFMLTDTSSGGWAVTAGVRGTVEFDTPSGGQIAPLGLRAASIAGGFTITTIPVIKPPGAAD
ncbi:MAG: BACON domain-containing protein [Bryobacteraceae bacterium]